MRSTKKIVILEFLAFVCTLSVVLCAYFNQSYSFSILLILAVMLLVVCICSGVYYPIIWKQSVESNKNSISRMIDIINAYVIIWREDCSSVIFNKYAGDSFGSLYSDYKPAEIIEILFPQHIFGKERASELLKNTGREVEIDINGITRIIVWNTSILMNSTDGRFFISIGLDLSDIKAVENELRLSENKYAVSMELSEIGVVLNTDSGLYLSEQFRKMTGITVPNPDYRDIREKVHPNDRMTFDKYIAESHGFNDLDEVYSAELRIRSADNKYHYYLYRYGGSHNFSGGAFIDITREKEKDLRVERLAYIDEATEIYNRNKLMITGQETYDCCKSLGYSYWVIVLDIDKFHIINDTCGYSNGNLILKNFAHIMYKYISLGGLGARIGGDNFALVIRKYSNDYDENETPRKTIEKIQNDVSKLAQGVFSNQTFSCSAGYSQMPADGKDFAEVLDHAEFALSSNKGTRGSIVAYSSEIHDSIIDISSMERALADAILNNELELHYQPKINLSDGRIIGAEALIRWRKPDGTIVPPGKFVPVAETSRLITQIGDYVMLEACRQNKMWQDMGYEPIIVSINLTSVDFYQKDIKEAVTDTLAKTGLNAEWLEIELTESLALKDIDLAIKQMEGLRSMGIRLAMDDFGTGYSSLSYIQILPITLLKLDRSFIINLETDDIAREIVSAVIKIAKSKKIETIAEGIENAEQAKILCEEGCDYAQGYYYGKPMPPDEFEQFLKKFEREH